MESTTGEKIYLIDSFIDKETEEIKSLMVYPTFDNNYLFDANQYMVIKYNPVLSGYKYVTQESISNSIGGKFPIIRINGDTKYRQFNLSGVLTFNSDYSNLAYKSSFDSKNNNMQQWIKNDSNTLLFDIPTFLNIFSEDMIETIKNSPSFLEKKYRDIAIDFLTNQKPKIFKGAEEDMMIVYLSNVSFTPNKQLGREIWDFSCTVTEFCEYNNENLQRYNLLKSSDVLGTLITQRVLAYALKMSRKAVPAVDENGNEVIVMTDYIALEDMIDNIPVLKAFWRDINKDTVTVDDL
jgi:hypothetical protein